MTAQAPVVLETIDVGRVFTVGQGMFRKSRTLQAVSGVSIELRRGETLGLVGESGCGKSTLAKMLLGLLPPTQGQILFGGEPVSGIDRKTRARKIQPIFQDPYSSLNPRKSIESIILLPIEYHQIGEKAERAKRVREIMDLVGLSPRLAQNYPHQLSGGQRQRVAIARALIMEPDVIICDEPTSALDVSVQSQILNLLQDLQKELNLTYLLISHNLAVVGHLADRVAVMYLGRIVEESDVRSLFDLHKHPYTEALIGSVLTADPRLGIPDVQLGASFPDPMNPPPGCVFHPRCSKALDKCRTHSPNGATVAGHAVSCFLHQ